jgi:FkbM family methyltransferase
MTQQTSRALPSGAAAILWARSVYRDQSEAALLQAFLPEPAGVFVEVGANDPIAGSQTYALEQRGWRGLLVEPLGECAAQLRAKRTAHVCEAAAGAPQDAGRMLPLLVAGALSTLSSRIKAKVTPSETRLVPIRTLDDMLAEASVEHIDFLSIDVEGAEINVLKGFSLERRRPRLILIEDDVHHLDKHRYLTAQGYKLVRRTNLNNWYVPNGTAFPVSLRGRWQFFRKMRLGTPLRRWRYRLSLRGERDGA